MAVGARQSQVLATVVTPVAVDVAEIVGDAWAQERRPVPGRPGLPPEVWIAVL